MAEVSLSSMQYAIFLHFFFAFYMYSNSQIFTYSGSKAFAWLDYTKSQTSGGFGSILGTNRYIFMKN
jgi:hypothetical protein